MKPKSMNLKIAYAYFSPKGYLQVRSIGATKKESRDTIPLRYGPMTYKDYEEAGFTLVKISVNITPLDQ